MAILLDSIKVKILVTLKEAGKELPYSEIAQKVGGVLPEAVLAHLDILENAGLVKSGDFAPSAKHPERLERCYEIVIEKVLEAVEQVDEMIEPLRS